MAFAIYKPGQGYWTRLMTVIGVGAMVLAGVAWLWRLLEQHVESNYLLYIQAGVSVAILLATAFLMLWFYRHPRITDFMIATEAEMRKVSWPSRREITGSTWVVVVGTFLFAILLLVVDVFFAWFFHAINVLAG